jgi:hypothetical protein
LRLASQVQARNQQLAAGDGWNDDVLLVTHVKSVSGRPCGLQPDGPYRDRLPIRVPQPLPRGVLQTPDTVRGSQQQHIGRPMGE